MNFLCCPKKKIVLDLENTYCYIEENTSTDSDGQTSATDILYIFNDYKNLVGIDLNSSNIKRKPAKFYYKFSGIYLKYGVQESTNELNRFLRGSTDFKNPFHFDVRKYMKKVYGNISYIISNRYVKLNDNFFIYHFKDPLGCSCVSIIMIIISIIFNCYFPFFMISMIRREKDLSLIIIYIICIIVPNIILYIIYKSLKCCFENILRIDCIFSKDFDRIFIGLVKYSGTSYANTFEFQMNDIERFVLQKEGNAVYNLKVVFKNKETQDIYRITNKTQEELEGLAYLLNKRLINNINNENKETEF